MNIKSEIEAFVIQLKACWVKFEVPLFSSGELIAQFIEFQDRMDPVVKPQDDGVGGPGFA